MRREAAIVMLVLGLGCGRDAGSAPAPEAGRSVMDEAHVVFTRGALVIDRLEVAVSPPVTAASRPGPTTLRSDDPRVVSVDDQGRLVAHASGSAVVRAGSNSSALEVTVAVPSSIRAVPGRVVLAPRGSAALVVRDGEGAELLPDAVVWNTSAPAAVVVVGGKAHSLGPTGAFELTATIGKARVVVPVTVSEGGGGLVVSPARARMRRGEVALFRAAGASGPVSVEWRSDDPRTLASVAQGLFQAMRPGRARACAQAEGRETCSEVEVAP